MFSTSTAEGAAASTIEIIRNIIIKKPNISKISVKIKSHKKKNNQKEKINSATPISKACIKVSCFSILIVTLPLYQY